MKDQERIIKILEHLKLNQKDFCELTGISRATLSQIISGKQTASNKTIEAIYRSVPELSLEWLMLGTGDMLQAGRDSNLPPDSGNGASAESVQPKERDVNGQSTLFSQEEVRRNPDYIGKVSRVVDVKKADTPRRHITEIRVFYSDGTYESFAGNKP